MMNTRHNTTSLRMRLVQYNILILYDNIDVFVFISLHQRAATRRRMHIHIQERGLGAAGMLYRSTHKLGVRPDHRDETYRPPLCHHHRGSGEPGRTLYIGERRDTILKRGSVCVHVCV